MTHRPTVVAAALLSPVLLGGCTLGGAEADDDPTGAAPAPAPAEEEPQGIGETVDVLLAAAGTESVDLSGELPVVATRAASNDYGDFEVDLNGVAVRDELMTVVFTLRVTAFGGSIFSINDTFDDGTTREREGDSSGTTGFSTDGVYVLDPTQGTRHLVAYDSEGGCVCSVGLNDGLDEGGSLTLSSTFAAPPEATTTVDVVIPSVGAFTGVTLER